MVVASLDILGGHGVQAIALAQRLRAEGCEVTLHPINPPFPRGLGWVRRLPWLRTLLNQSLYLPSLRHLRAADMVHVFAASYWSFLLAPAPAVMAARAWGKPVVLNYHSGEAADHLARWGPLVHPFLKMADAIAVPSVYLREIFARHGYTVQVVPNLVDLARFRYRERAPLRPRLLSTRNLEPHYRVDDVLEAFALVQARHPEAHLDVAGSGSEGERLHRLATARGRAGVRFLGRVEPAAMPGLYAADDIYLNASVVDNQPLSVLEAFAAGLPVVSTGTGDLATMVRDGETGLRVPARDPAAIAAAVMALLEDPARARQLARQSRQEVEKHTWASVGPAWMATYAAAAGAAMAAPAGAAP
jgi:glycosyltransferase involved in cell wall biosynthesis